MSFFSALGDQINSQFLGGEMVPQERKFTYEKLGDFAAQIDQSAQRKYVEEGYLRFDSNNVRPKLFEILTQQPEATLLVKKKMFSTLSGNYNTDYANIEEKLFIRASNILFRNKAKQIAAFEALTKIQTASVATGQLDEQLMPFILGLSNQLLPINLGDFGKIVAKVKTAYNYSASNFYTKWIDDVIYNMSGSLSKFVMGTGTIEFTNFTRLGTNVSVGQGSGSFNIDFSDPYEMMTVTISDIEKSIAETINPWNRPVINFSKESLDDIINRKISDLNSARQARGASNIVLKINPNTISGRRLIAIVEATGQEIVFEAKVPGIGSVEVKDPYLIGGDVLGNQGLDDRQLKKRSADSNLRPNGLFKTSELTLFADAVNAIYNKIAFEINTTNNFNFSSADADTLDKINFLKKKMMFYFGGKNIIQPMDEVHIYLSSKTRSDDKVLSGIQNAFSGLGFFQKLNNTVYDIDNSFSSIFKPSENLDFQTEKAAFIGTQNIPDMLWSTMRSYFLNDKSGTHVYAGLVTESRSSYSNGNFSVSVSGTDNKHYLEQGKINFNPAVDVFNGVLYDPLTPYKTTFDSVYSLKDEKLQYLDENALLLGDNTSPLLKFKDGPYINGGVTQNNLYQEEIVSKNGDRKKIFYAPDGLVYRWKEGIGILAGYGTSDQTSSTALVGAQNVTTDPYAGQDMMNVASLLVTGSPYNFYTYYKAAIASGGYNNGPNQTSSQFYALEASIKKNNSLWGKFIPFKFLSLDDESYKLIIQGRVQSLLKQQQGYLNQIKELQNKQLLATFAAVNNDKENADKIKTQYETSILNKLTEIDQSKTDFNNSLKTSTKVPFTIIGNDVSFDYDPIFNSAAGSTTYSDTNYRRLLAKKIGHLTQRPSWKVRANQDFNYFIVDDNYDKDYDILAFETQFKDMKLFNNEFLTVLDKINVLIKMYNLEFFADTQGHLRIRPPQYNKIPSSVFYNMIYQQKNTGIRVFPQFLLELFYVQISGLIDKLSTIEDQIRLYCAVADVGNTLDMSGDFVASQFIRNSSVNSAQTINSGNSSTAGKNLFSFISDPTDGTILNLNKTFSNLFSNPTVHPDQSKRNDAFIVISAANQIIQDQVNLASSFDALARLESFAVRSATRPIESVEISNLGENPTISKLLRRLQEKTGKKYNLDEFLNSEKFDGAVNFQDVYQIDFLRVTQRIAEKIVERQKVIKSLYGITKNAKEAMSLDVDPSQAKNLLFPNITGNKEVPEVFQSMIEDESYDEYGPGSGKRFVIKNSQILNYGISESPPRSVMVEVQGRISPGFSNNAIPPPTELNNLPQQGNALTSATAVDYDLWRMYGFKSNIDKFDMPTLSDPESQCAPFAAAQLTRIRKDIIKGRITIVGNEYMQPGDVVFIEQKNMLFYVETVSHDFSYGGNFTTSLTLSYGHYPGEYIPTTVDLIGKMMYNNRDSMSVINYRQTSSKEETNIGVFVLDPSLSEVPQDTSKLGGETYAQRNLTTLQKVIQDARAKIEFNSSKKKKIIVELRIYTDTNPNYSAGQDISNVFNYAFQIYGLLVGSSDAKLALGNNVVINSIPVENMGDVKTIDFDDKERTASPSQQAMSFVRDLVNTKIKNSEPKNNAEVAASLGAKSQNPIAYNYLLRKYLNRCIVDCYIKTEYI